MVWSRWRRARSGPGSRTTAMAALVPLAASVIAAGSGLAPAGTPASVGAPPDVDPRVDTIVRPLGAAPSIVTVDEPVEVELDGVGPLDEISASLVPSFGHVHTPVDLEPEGAVQAGVPSGLWPDRTVTAATFGLPSDVDVAGLYDLQVTWAGDGSTGEDLQRRAVSVVEAHPDAPRVVVIADPSAGDPRPIQDGVNNAAAGDPGSLVDKTDRTLGVSDGNGRWGALKQTIDEVNLVRPDFVLVAGDLTFGVHPRALPYEYEDAWRLLDQLEVPTFLAPGNHDLYALDHYAGNPGAIDGLAMWEAYFGPTHYSIDVGPAFHLVVLNTFDWEQRMPFPPPDFDTRSGGQIRAEQLEWLRGDLAGYRAGNPRGQIVTLAHHDPSWVRARHPWSGQNRLEVRNLLAAHDVGAHFAGHTHEDRVARYHRGNIVQTSGRPHRGDPIASLSYLRRDDTIDESWSQRRLGRILRRPQHGPLFVTTTTAGSGLVGEDWGLGGYWGWRLADLTPEPRGGYDPAGFGYPASRGFLDEYAERPEHWNPDHAAFGLFSYPAYHLSQQSLEGNDGQSDHAVVEVTSDLDTDLATTLRVVVGGDATALQVDGGELVRTRTDGNVTDVWVATNLPAHGQRTVTVTTRPTPDPTAAGGSTDVRAGDG